MKSLAMLVPMLLGASACVTMPEVYAPPIQRKPALAEDAPRASKRLLRMVEPETDAYIVQDLPLRGVFRGGSHLQGHGSRTFQVLRE
jgi:hypothetical protein